jgi:uncharacterized DUF497 family protein
MQTSSFDWDEGNRQKCQKHGLAIADIEHVLSQAETIIIPATGFEESRFIGIGRTPGGRLAFVVFTFRVRHGDRKMRPISARYMHRKEIRNYGEAIAGLQKR